MKKPSDKIFFLLLIISPITLFSQEIVCGLQGNIVAEKYYAMHPVSKKTGLPADTIELPFIDDFSDSYVEPRKLLWSDRYAYINSNYAVYPPTLGVATLDALNFNGSHYQGASFFPYQADYLTSQPINLSYPVSDSIYLSFFFQPGGLAEPPETGDSLIVDFYSTDNLRWEKVWATPGPGLPQDFKMVMIKIEKAEYLKKGFRFRFRNYASYIANNDLADKRANNDIWNIDYVKIDKNRQISDTLLRDVAFMEPMKSILKEYTSLPWTHFEAAYNTQRAPFIEVVLENHDNISRNVGTALEIKDLLHSNPVYKVSVFNNNISSGDSIHYKYSYNYKFNLGLFDSAAFEIKAIIQTDVFDFKPNDTLRHIQKFYDYYALDDETAEASYGFRGAGTKGVSSALKYNSFIGDSLRAIDMYFVQLIDSLNLQYYFYLNVWNDNNGKPGIKVVDQIGMRPEYSDKLNKFIRYQLDAPVFIQGAFYIGFTQTTEHLLNVGLDMNHENKLKIFNNADNGTWNTTTILPGTPMMRPVFSKDLLLLNDFSQSSPTIKVWPIPADKAINISINNSNSNPIIMDVELIDISGRVIRKINTHSESSINTLDLPNGMYLLRLNDPYLKRYHTTKVIISH